MEPDHHELLAQVAYLYFDKGQDQSAIARKLRVSRSSVSRLLTQARNEGVVEIRIHFPLTLARERADELREQFGLRDARVLQASARQVLDAKGNLARLAARYLHEAIAPGDTIALSRGSTVQATIEQFTPTPRRETRVVQLVGMLRVDGAEDDDANLTRELAQKLGGDYFNLTAPLFVENPETRRALLHESSIRNVLNLARHAQLALVGIGALDRQNSAIVRQKLLPPAQLQILRQGHVVGEICSQYFDAHGEIVSTELSERTMALGLDALREIPRVIGVAVGRHKAKAILAALRGKYINTLITDAETAALVLDYARNEKRDSPQVGLTRGVRRKT